MDYRHCFVAAVVCCLFVVGCSGGDGSDGEGDPPSNDAGPTADATSDTSSPSDGGSPSDADESDDDTGGGTGEDGGMDDDGGGEGDGGGSGDDGGMGTDDGGGTGDGGGTDDGGMDDGGTGDDGGGVSCSSGLTACGGTCVDLETNGDFCGDCNTSCGADQVCSGGSCADRSSSLLLSEVNNHPPRFFELYNGSTSPVDLDGWQIQWQTADGASGTTVLPAENLAADEFVAVYSDGDQAPDDAITLDSEVPAYEAVGVRLLQPGGSGADFVRTGNSSVSPGPGDDWTGNTPSNPSPGLDQSLVRSVYEPDTDSGDDWHLTTPSSADAFCPRPGQCGTECVDQSSNPNHCGGCGITCGANQICREGSCTSPNNDLWLTEYRRFPTPGVEIQNPTAQPISLDNYRLEVGSEAYTFPSRTLESGEYLFVAAGDGADADRTVFSGIVETAFSHDQHVSLFDETSQALDFVRFGNSQESAPSGTAWFGDSVPAPAGNDESARRNTDKQDTDSATDWVIDTPSSPGVGCPSGLSSCEGYCVDRQIDERHCGACGNHCDEHESCVEGTCQSAGGVVLSELRNDDPELIEIHNGGTSSVDLSDWSLEWTADNGSGDYTIPSGTSLEAGEFLVFEEAGGSAGGRMDLNSPVRWNTGISVTLFDASDTPVDFVRTGSASTGPPSGAAWSGSNADNPADDDGEALVRSVYEPDTDTADDWSIRGAFSDGRYCVGGSRTCGTQCAHVNDEEHCGVCGRNCPASDVCRDGECDRLEGAMRISGGGSSGRIEIHLDGRWETVCDDGFDDVDAAVACRQMGYDGGHVDHGSDTDFGDPEIRNVQCSGGEARLTQCSYEEAGTICSQYEDVGVDCN